MRTVSDEAIITQANQPDINYLGDTQLMDVAASMNYSYDDYVFFIRSIKSAKRHVYSDTLYTSVRESLREQERDYLAGCVEQQGHATDILSAHW